MIGGRDRASEEAGDLGAYYSVGGDDLLRDLRRLAASAQIEQEMRRGILAHDSRAAPPDASPSIGRTSRRLAPERNSACTTGSPRASSSNETLTGRSRTMLIG